MNKYLIWFKVNQIQATKSDFKADINPFTRKDFFYYFVKNGIKYIHKQSLKGVYTNAFTYSMERDTPNFCLINDRPKGDAFDRILRHIKTKSGLMPEITDNGKFITYPIIKGETLTSVTKEQFFELKKYHKGYTPFYNSMCYNLVSTQECIKIIDMKHFEMVDEKPFFIFMNNDEHRINTLYMEENQSEDLILKHLNLDYVVTQGDIVYY